MTGSRVRWVPPLAALLVSIVVGGASAEPRLFDLALKDGRLPESQRLVKVVQGDEVTLKWTTDRPFTLHLHGYDLEARLVPAAPVELRFTASATGRFPMEIHGPGWSGRSVISRSIPADLLPHRTPVTARRRRLAWGGSAVLTLLPGEALAHGFGQRYDLPVPLWLWAAAAGAAVALSFVIIGLFVRASPGVHGYWRPEPAALSPRARPGGPPGPARRPPRLGRLARPDRGREPGRRPEPDTEPRPDVHLGRVVGRVRLCLGAASGTCGRSSTPGPRSSAGARRLLGSRRATRPATRRD